MFQEPIVFSLLPSKREGYTCAYWNETMKAWDSAGVTEVYDSKGGLRCCLGRQMACFAVHIQTGEQVIVARTQLW